MLLSPVTRIRKEIWNFYVTRGADQHPQNMHYTSLMIHIMHVGIWVPLFCSVQNNFFSLLQMIKVAWFTIFLQRAGPGRGILCQPGIPPTFPPSIPQVLSHNEVTDD